MCSQNRFLSAGYRNLFFLVNGVGSVHRQIEQSISGLKHIIILDGAYVCLLFADETVSRILS